MTHDIMGDTKSFLMSLGISLPLAPLAPLDSHSFWLTADDEIEKAHKILSLSLSRTLCGYNGRR
jgi:hypothetical protein